MNGLTTGKIPFSADLVTSGSILLKAILNT